MVGVESSRMDDGNLTVTMGAAGKTEQQLPIIYLFSDTTYASFFRKASNIYVAGCLSCPLVLFLTTSTPTLFHSLSLAGSLSFLLQGLLPFTVDIRLDCLS